MGQHRTNPNVIAVARGELKRRVKAPKALSKREESFLAHWAEMLTRRPQEPAGDQKLARHVARDRKRLAAWVKRTNHDAAMMTLRERQKAARRVA